MKTEGTVRRRLKAPRYTGTALLLSAVLVAVGIVSSAIGLNVVYVFLAIGLLLLIERTVGDWLSEVLGPTMRRVIFGVLVCLVGWQLLAANGRLRSVGEFLGLNEHWLVWVPTGGMRVASSGSSAPVPVGPEGGSGSAAVAPRTSGSGVARRSLSDGAAAAADSRSAPQVRVQSVSSTTGVRLEVQVAGKRRVEGIVDILINGRHVATGRVRADGSVEAHIPDPGPGVHQVVVRFKGEGIVGDATAATTLVR